MINDNQWEPIHGFSAPSEYQRFIAYLEQQISEGSAIETEVTADGKGGLWGGRYFRQINSDAVWRLIPPDFPFKGLFETV